MDCGRETAAQRRARRKASAKGDAEWKANKRARKKANAKARALAENPSHDQGMPTPPGSPTYDPFTEEPTATDPAPASASYGSASASSWHASAADVKVEEEEEQVASAVLHNPEDIPWHDRWTEWDQPEEISLDIVDEEEGEEEAPRPSE